MSGFLINIGRKRTLWVSGAILLVSIYLIAFFLYLISKHEIYYEHLFDNIIKEALTVIFFSFLLIFIYKGKKWARNILLIVFLIKTYYSLQFIAYMLTVTSYLSIFTINFSLIEVIVYFTAIIHFAFSKSFKTFAKHQNSL